jgi:DNA polymerase III subunit alpha
MDPSFVHLRVYSEYSLLESAARIEPLVKRAKGMGMTALALTDKSVMYGAIPFYQACRREGIKPVLGLEISVTNAPSLVRVPTREEAIFQLVLLAETLEGYRNLMRLASAAQLDGGDYRPRVTKEHLRRYAKGLIALSAAGDGEIGRLLLDGREEEARLAAAKFVEIYGRDSFFLEIQDHLLEDQKLLNQRMASLGRAAGISLAATNSVRYVDREQSETYEVLLCIGQGKTIDDPERERPKTREYSFKSPSEMSDLFAFTPEAIQNTVRIAERCTVELPLGSPILPRFPIKEKRADEYLRERCYDGLKSRYGEQISAAHEERLDYELGVIERMGFSDYFLIVWDFICYAREKGIAVGPGRGSAAGSLVAYVLYITDIDPLKYKLLFERFLNPERISMPDIDIDFSYDRRDEVIAYVVNKYGTDRVAQIITFGTMAARAAIRDVGRVLNMAPAVVGRIAKLIPAEPGMTLDKAVKKSAELRQILEQNMQAEKLFRLARAVEGMPRHASTHAAGIVISRDSLTEHVPLQEGHDGHSLTQYSMEQLEEIGLLKMDFLGLRNLTLLEHAVELVLEQEGKQISLQDIPLDDAPTYRLLSEADTTGVFQLESGGMRHVLRIVKPSIFEDIVAVLALFRPGPMEFIPDFAAAKHGKRRVEYLHPILEPILKDTYGYILYQEQIMQIASAVAGFTLGEADILRRAVSKKKKELLAEQREKFVAGCLNQGHDEALGNQLYDWIVRFADYGFNRSHSAAYGVLSYRMAYIKANHPLSFMAALLTMVMGSADKTAEYVEECRRKSIAVLAPDINKSQVAFTVENGAIRFGLGAVKNVGVQAVRHLIEERKNGPFTSLPDMCLRIDARVVNRRVLESLILCGALDSLPGHRAAFLASLDQLTDWAGRVKKEKAENQIVLFQGESKNALPPEIMGFLTPYTKGELLEQERELLGMYLSGHPLEPYTGLLEHPSITPIHLVRESKQNQAIRIAGLIAEAKRITTKKGEPMAFLTLEDKHARIEVVAFPRVFESGMALIKKDKFVIIEGRVDRQNGENDIKFIANRLFDGDGEGMPHTSMKQQTSPVPDTVSKNPEQVVYIKVERELEEDVDGLTELKGILLQTEGNSPVMLYYAASKRTVQLKEDYCISPNGEIVRKIEKIVGSGGIIIKNRA